ncbi:unnamed protein product [Peniophora sp. CBMAI 1063]|nr:unnamed protein product [Peniophora sp. CBMAI 1063]
MPALTGPSTVLAFKAGRAFRRGDTNFVDASPEKGALLIEREEDMIHLVWKNRETGSADEDLLLFPGDATFIPVPQAPGGRVYVLKFESSEARHFFYMQDGSTARDEEFAHNVNSLIQDPSYVPVWQEPSAAPDAEPAAGSTSSSQLDQIRELMSRMAANAGGAEPVAPEFALSDILTPGNLLPLFSARPDLVAALFPHLPPDLPEQPSREVLQRVIQSPQFRAAVASLDRALRTGMLQGLMGGLGLPEEAGSSVAAFLRAVKEQAERDGGESSMQTD